MEYTINDIAVMASSRSVADVLQAIELLSKNFNNYHTENATHDILCILSRNEHISVRKKLAAAFKCEPRLPEEVAYRLATDVLKVGAVYLSCAAALRDEQVIAILHHKTEVERQLAVTHRSKLSSKLTKFLYFLGEYPVIKSMVQNPGAELSELTLHRILDDYPYDEAIIIPLTERAGLPIVIAARLMEVAPMEAKERLLDKYNIPAIILFNALHETELADRIEIRNETQQEEDAFDIVQHFKEEERLRFSLIIGALCIGDMVFFETAIAVLAEVPLGNAQRLIRDKGGMEARALYRAAGFPESIFKALGIMAKLAYEALDTGAVYIQDFQHHVLAKIHRKKYDHTIPQMSHFVSIIEKNLTSDERS